MATLIEADYLIVGAGADQITIQNLRYGLVPLSAGIAAFVEATRSKVRGQRQSSGHQSAPLDECAVVNADVDTGFPEWL
ncbi:MAG: hypothetical protein HOI95_22895 [Chromatiales bacterium]|nr:hypothetical protein [Chromatiales bacterium]